MIRKHHKDCPPNMILVTARRKKKGYILGEMKTRRVSVMTDDYASIDFVQGPAYTAVSLDLKLRGETFGTEEEAIRELLTSQKFISPAADPAAQAQPGGSP